jgi:hypothetical protein
MELVLATPPGWPGDGATLRVIPPRPRPCDLRAWLRETLGGERVLESRRLATTDGWPFDLMVVVGATTRLVAIYHLDGPVAAALVDGEVVPDAPAILASARPDFSSAEVAALDELWTRP